VTNPVLSGGFLPTYLYPAGDSLYAVGYGQTGGVLDGFELWEIDPAATGPAGATFVQELGTNARGAMSAGYWGRGRVALVADGQYLYFPASTPEHGMEPYRLPLADAPPAYAVVGRHVFYNQSAFDGQNPLPSADDDNAIATDKQALLPGQAASPANVTSFARGINGLMIDVTAGLPLTALAGLTGNVRLQTSSSGNPGTWADAPRPTQIAIRAGAGAGESDRLTLLWTDGAIRNTWLKVTVPVLPPVGLTRPDEFIFGNLVGETGDALTPLRVSASDLAGAKRALNSTAPVTSPYDVNRDGKINALDLGLIRANLFRTLGPVIAPPPSAAAVVQGVGPADLLSGTSARRVWDEPETPLI